MKRMFGFMLGAVVGAAIGSVVALLFAPESGEELRLQIRDRGEQFGNELKDAAATRRAQLEDRLAMLRRPEPPAPAPDSASD
jgi:gas vesicle protein